jgi:hypothetical protein
MYRVNCYGKGIPPRLCSSADAPRDIVCFPHSKSNFVVYIPKCLGNLSLIAISSQNKEIIHPSQRTPDNALHEQQPHLGLSGNPSSTNPVSHECMKNGKERIDTDQGEISLRKNAMIVVNASMAKLWELHRGSITIFKTLLA